MSAITLLAQDCFWTDKSRYDNAERQFYEDKEALLHKHNAAAEEDSALEEEEDSGYAAISKSFEIDVAAAAVVPTAKGATKLKKSKKTKEVKLAEVPAPNEELLTTTAVEAKASAKKSKKKQKSAAKKEKLAQDKENAIVAAAYNNNNAGQNADDCSREASASPLNRAAALNARNLNRINAGNNGPANKAKGTTANSQCTLVSEIAKAREHIKNSLEKMDGIANLAASPASSEVLERLQAIERENADMRKLVESLRGICQESQKRINTLEQQLGGKSTASAAASTVAKKVAAPVAAAAADDDDGVDLFASDSEEDDADAARIREERLAAYAAKKSKKPALIAKSSLVLDCKPWDDETDMKAMETEIRKITADGLLWGASKCVPVAFGIQKLSISCVVEDEKVSIDWLTEEIEKFEDFVQSVDVAAFNKI